MRSLKGFSSRAPTPDNFLRMRDALPSDTATFAGENNCVSQVSRATRTRRLVDLWKTCGELFSQSRTKATLDSCAPRISVHCRANSGRSSACLMGPSARFLDWKRRGMTVRDGVTAEGTIYGNGS